ncbi:hypothetical protein CSV86_013490 [Pseudomonas putida CSV86]|uniref:Uncharacterized protein n=1 Tax=Pseudomonas bharatica CSV86 TaxID=1005395 RepID=A0A7K4EEU4_9PSED|nr:hypothetical protein [Pseudomonas bharatica CSV86]
MPASTPARRPGLQPQQPDPRRDRIDNRGGSLIASGQLRVRGSELDNRQAACSIPAAPWPWT